MFSVSSSAIFCHRAAERAIHLVHLAGNGEEWVVTIFEKIVRREIPADIVWEDDDVLAFRDVNPQAPVHVLIVPKRVVARLADATEADQALLGKLLLASRTVAEKLDLLTSGYRVVINSGPDAGESVPHLHVHVLGKRALAWPPG
ncbi:MAG: histidine triad family protein [Verrucomicrobiota bacterium]|jgi:histidine triad (HIT) family protein